MVGTIMKGIGGFYYVKASDSIYECKARGIFRKEKITPMIGDKVNIETDGEKGSIIEIMPRKSSLIRPPVANLIDKILINAEINNITPVICINKTDIKKREDIEEIYSKAKYKIFSVSAERQDGTDLLMDYLKDKTTAFAGLSGVGKSSLLSIITNGELETGSISEKISRGKHTTRHVELFELESGGFVLDTPGFSSLEIENIKADDLWQYFPEMADSQNKCRFRGCSHINEPDCYIKEKLKNGEMAQSRYDSYTQIYNKLKSVKEWIKK